MPLSEYEQHVLDQMERQLTSDDPRLASTLQSPGRRSTGHWVLVGGGLIAGLMLLVAGAAMPQQWLGVSGFLLMFATVTFTLAGPRSRGGVGAVRPGESAAVPRRTDSRASGRRGRVMSRLEERWKHRRRNGR